MPKWYFCFVFLVVACDSSDPDGSSQPECGPLEDGTYRFRLVPESGDCDTETYESLVQVSGGDGAASITDPDCTTLETLMPDECTASLTWECDFPGDGIIATYTAELEARMTESSGDVAIAIHDRDTNALLCSGIYRATWEKNKK